MVTKRDLFATVKMLRAGGLDADVRVGRRMVEVFLGRHAAVFRPSDLALAADWLAACAVMHYPKSDFARLWLFLAGAAGQVLS